MVQDDALLIDRGNDIVTMTMNRPPANALNNGLVERLLDAFRALASQAAPPGIVLTGQGARFFSAGGDIKEVTGIEISRPRMRSFHALLCEMERYPAPLVCAVRGYAVGGALEFLLHADYVVANGECKIDSRKSTMVSCLRRKECGRRYKDWDFVRRRRCYTGANWPMQRKHSKSERSTKLRRPQTWRYGRWRCAGNFAVWRSEAIFGYQAFAELLTGQMDDASLEAMTIEDLGAYRPGDSSADARARFLSKNEK